MSLENLLREVLADIADEVTPDRGAAAGPGHRDRGAAAGPAYRPTGGPAFAPAGSRRVGPPPDRAGIAVARVRRRRRATVLAAAAAAVLVLAGALAVPALRPGPDGSPAGTPGPGPASTSAPAPSSVPTPRAGPPPVPLPPLPVVDGLAPTALARTGPYQLTSFRTPAGAAVRPPGATVFRRLPWPEAAVSPTGRVAVVDDSGRIGVIDDLTGGGIRWQSAGGPVVHPTWSPDGRTVLASMLTAAGPTGQRFGAALLDTVTWTVRQVQLDDGYADLSLGEYGLSWDPRGDRLVGTADRTTDGDRPGFGLRWWDLTGAAGRTVPLPGLPGSANTQALSPSGDRVAASTGQGVVVVAGRDGREQARPSTTATAVHGWRDDDHVVAEEPGGLVLLALDGTTRPYATRTGEATDPGITRVAP